MLNLGPAILPAPNKAQNPAKLGAKQEHSPLPWHGSDMNPYEVRSGRTHASYNRRIADCREANCICYTAEDTANARLIVRAVNHADKLAEESKTLAMLALQSTRYTTDTDYRNATDNVLSTLSAYKAAQ